MIFIKIISHRGSNVSIYKPNTKEALLEALQYDYIDGIEFDVRITKDKKIVIIHDLLINFISNGKGIVKKMKLNKLLKYNFGTNKLKQKICTLDELLKKIKSNKIIIIEIKEETNNYKDIVNNTYLIIKKYPYLNIYISSFNYELLCFFNNNYPIKSGLLIGLFLNTKRLYNHFTYNIVDYQYKDRISIKKETFLWNINKKVIKDYNVITDYPYLFKN